MADIKVNSQMLRDAAGQIRREHSNFVSLSETISNGLSSLSNSWEGEAFTSFCENVKALEPTFDKYAEVINSYAVFLENSAEDYEENERQVSAATGDIVNNLFK